MSIALDLMVVAVALIIIISDTCRGFIRAFMNLASNVVSLLLAYAFAPKVGQYFQNAFMDRSITSGIRALLSSLSESSGGEPTKLSELAQNDMFQSLVQRFGANSEEIDALTGGNGEATEAAVNRLSEIIGSPVSRLLAYVLAFIAIFLVSLLAIRLLGRLINLVTKAPDIRVSNRILGFVFGLVSAFVTAWVMSLVFSYLMTALGALNADWFGNQVIEQTHVVRYLAQLNPVEDVIEALIHQPVA